MYKRKKEKEANHLWPLLGQYLSLAVPLVIRKTVPVANRFQPN